MEPARIRGNRGEGKTPETYGGRKFIASNPRGVHAVRQVHAPCVEMPVNRGSITTLIYLEMALSNKRRSKKHGGFYVTGGYLADKECGVRVSWRGTTPLKQYKVTSVSLSSVWLDQ